MKRFYEKVDVCGTDVGWIVQLDDCPIKTQGGRPQALPTEALATTLAQEWRAQGEEIDPSLFRARDMADYAIDIVAPDPAGVADKLLGYAETDTLCYRSDPDEPLWRRQREVWDPIVEGVEAREGITLERVSGIIHRAQPGATLERLGERLRSYDPFTLAALDTATSLAASLCVGLEAMQPDADGDALWDAANLEENWQADLWGRDEEAEERRAANKQAFLDALAFARAARA